MQTNLAAAFRETSSGREADAILRACVHCGFCLATCPTYQLLGDELDSPRGRIYLMKEAFEGAEIGRATQLHLDRCLTCRSCETTCPSGVQYGRLIDIGRAYVSDKVTRPWPQRIKRFVLRKSLAYPRRFAFLYLLAKLFKPLLPMHLRRQLTTSTTSTRRPGNRHARSMLLLEGCVQPSLAPEINAAAVRVLDRLGITLFGVAEAGCCGALDHHLDAHHAALQHMRRNIDAWWPHIEAGAEAIVITASGCGTHVKDYARLLSDDSAYAERAARISAMTLDLSEAIAAEELVLERLLTQADHSSLPKIAFHAPCTLQHGQRIVGVVERLLRAAGYPLAVVPDAHLCCGSAGTYSILQPDLAAQLRENKLVALESDAPEIIATANIGCLTHLRGGSERPIRHWIELLDARLLSAAGNPVQSRENSFRG